MNTKLYVDNLAATMTHHELMELFSVHGNVADVNLPVDRANGRPRGFGFITMETAEGARAAMGALNGKELGTHTLTVSEAWPHEERGGSPAGNRSPLNSL
jgi:RNA recognition motif-containing protein